MRVLSITASAILAAQCAIAIEFNVEDSNSIKRAASTIAHGMVSYYHGNTSGNTPGLLPGPYYWWEAGAMFGSLIDYWRYTGDETYNDIVTQALLFQASPNVDFMPSNQTIDEGNDDQAFWGMAAMSAAEAAFPNPPRSDQPQWLALAQGVFNSQVPRWDEKTCGGGLRWQIVSVNTGYNYKNSISQGGLFNIAARLGAYTQNQTYFDWAEKIYDWTANVGLISPTYQVFDGTDDNLNCSRLNHIQWTYNAGIFMHGAAVMWNHTTGDVQAKWHDRVDGFIKGSSVFFTGPQNKIMYEVTCEPQNNCDTDQLSFKAYLARWMAATTKVAPWTYNAIIPYLQASAQAAAQSCSGSPDGVTCGNNWHVKGWDNTFGVGQQMSALEVIQSNLIQQVQGPLSNSTGGTSKGDPNAGLGADNPFGGPTSVITTADRAGAGVLTAVLILGSLGGGWWMLS